MNGVLRTADVVLLWTVALLRSPAAWRSTAPRSLWGFFCALAAAFTLRVTPARGLVEDATGVRNLTLLLMHVMGIVAVGFLLHWVFLMLLGERVGATVHRAVAGLTVLVAAVVIGIFWLSFDDITQADPFLPRRPGNGGVAAYLAIWYVCLGAGMAAAAWVFASACRYSAVPVVRTGLAMSGAGCSLSVAYCAVRLLGLTGDWEVGDLDAELSVEDSVVAMQFLAVFLVLVGSSLPVAGSLKRYAVQYRRLQQLRPLWLSLTAAVPDVVLGPPPRLRDDLLPGGNLPLRLHRRVIEILDAELALRAHAPRGLRDRALAAAAEAGLREPERQAAAEAFWLGSAVEAKRAGRRPSRGDGPGLTVGQGADEADWLARVSAAYRSPSMCAISDLADRD